MTGKMIIIIIIHSTMITLTNNSIILIDREISRGVRKLARTLSLN